MRGPSAALCSIRTSPISVQATHACTRITMARQGFAQNATVISHSVGTSAHSTVDLCVCGHTTHAMPIAAGCRPYSCVAAPRKGAVGQQHVLLAMLCSVKAECSGNAKCRRCRTAASAAAMGRQVAAAARKLSSSTALHAAGCCRREACRGIWWV